MTKTNPWLLAAAFTLAAAVMTAAAFLKGGFYIGKHEGDTMQLAEIVLRMADGQWPHLDFMTPIGVLAMAPIAAFVKAGWGLGHAIFLAQFAVALAVLPGVVWVAHSRLGSLWSWAYGLFVMVLCVALVHGETQRAVSISMHYNRWAWAIAYVVLPLALLAPTGRRISWVDGLFVGLGMAALALIKMTFFVALAPAVLVAILARRTFAVLGWVVLSGLVVVAVVTALAGPAFWTAYLADLRLVAASEVRPQPGEPLVAILAAPAFMAATLVLLAIVIFLRQSGRMVEGLVLLVMMPGLHFIVFQNFGNDPQWLLLVGMFAFVLRPAAGRTNGLGWDMRAALAYSGAIALALGAGSAINLAYSPFRHLSSDTEKMMPLLSRLPQHDDILALPTRIYRVDTVEAADGPESPFARFRHHSDRKDVADLNGETLDECEQRSGFVAWFEAASDDLQAAGYGGSRLLAADLFSSFWLYGDFRPVRGAAPWYYGGLAGLEDADYLVVPMCPVSGDVRAGILKSLADGPWQLDEVRRTPLYILIRPTRKA